jgi:[amino group carrier protein]-6-phospho-L-2-aminoadipate/5-phospho-L-glutamate reductase
MSFTASIVGGSGYTGGELLRLLLAHPQAEVGQVTSRKLKGQPVHRSHPNLRSHLATTYSLPDDINPCDVLFLCMPHGKAAGEIDRWRSVAPLVIDLSADFRLRDPDMYQQWYGESHANPQALSQAVYGLPEVSRDQLPGASLISGVGCNATAMNLALMPLAKAGLIKRAIADIKVGSSEAGAEASAGSHHPVRARTARTYSPFGHRHLAEVIQAQGDLDIDATVTAIDMVRGVLCTAHIEPTENLDTKSIWKLYRQAYNDEPFVRIVADRSGPNRFPDPRILVGSNHADVGFTVDERSGRIIAISAIDNLVKGAAGSAIQSMNIALGLEETAGLNFPGLHPA